MSPSVTRLLRWAAVIGAGIALTLALWQDPVLAARPAIGTPTAATPVALTAPTALELAASAP
ncbi:hypothetical protein KBX37_22345 [Micromonospora sp. U56]|uniref:hypothetical protein n=1 Tax=Micromonospora sp. U56 TaxID=2824900 RepID=UPI001B390B97|nr:hypothetical protein [Micromonospora sp. U56]MBQ0895802.1 hypothetical protein [Micromonospora sp. U56]